MKGQPCPLPVMPSDSNIAFETDQDMVFVLHGSVPVSCDSQQHIWSDPAYGPPAPPHTAGAVLEWHWLDQAALHMPVNVHACRADGIVKEAESRLFEKRLQNAVCIHCM